MSSINRIRLLLESDLDVKADVRVVKVPNDVEPLSLHTEIEQAERVELDFPQFTDGRAYSQAYLIRKRLGYRGDLRAVGDVLADQVIQMERSGFTSAVLKNTGDLDAAKRQLALFPSFYQADVAGHIPAHGQSVTNEQDL